MKIVYITGCLGFIGSYITKACLNQGWYVYGIDKCTYASNMQMLNEFNLYPKFKFEKKDICELDRLVDCDYFINLAAETHVDNSIRQSKVFLESNITGVYNILELLKKYKKEGYVLPRFIHFSTDEVYGDIESGRHTENDLLKPSNPYSATKASADMLICAWARTFDIQFNIIRPTNNYGVGQYVEKLIPKSIKYLTLNRKIPLHDQGKPIRSWLHAKDTAEALITIINDGKPNEIYNVSGGFEQSNIDTTKKIISCFFGESIGDFEKYLSFDIRRPGHDVRYSLDDTKLRSIGWSAKCNFDNEIQSIVDYYKNNFIW